ncbi:hypothetical protein [Streptomyces nodosus]|uniref:Uncharacterized protein n=1 Tax=Streptomyces nodosus TaxID=40318 RepID=A0A5P2VUT9_9ACTN|nr:hypothetical protein [Streptomyces nodosus]MBB4789540.1 hypothetical protein [Streptomyces nodosus]QEV37370.1 hypothetical protein CP978_01200 [Streptomyces nodosus]
MTTPPPLEERLRAALEARGQLISAHDLSPAHPPTGNTWGTRRIRRVVSLAAATAAAAAAVVLLLSPNTPDRPRPTPPARHTSPTVTPPTTVPHPSGVPGDTNGKPNPSGVPGDANGKPYRH